MKTFREWSKPLVSPYGKWGACYNALSPDQKEFYKDAYEVFSEDPNKYADIEDYYNYTQHKFKYKLNHLFGRKGGNK